MLRVVSYSIVTIRRASSVNTRPATLVTAATVKRYLEEKQIDYKEGHASYLLQCPICDNTAKEKNGTPQYCVYINKTTGSVACQPCKMAGSWSDFDSWVQSKSIVQPPTNHDLLQCLNAAEKFWSKTLPWKMSVATVMNKAMKLFGSNHITSETLQKFDVRTVVGKFASPNGQEMDEQCLAYPYSNGKNIIRVKVESASEQAHKKAYFEPRQGSHGLFGWNVVKDSDKLVVLTANEFDAMAVYQVTHIPALALPNDCHNLSPELLPQLEQFEKIILWLGNDPKSKQSASNFAKKLNVERCYNVAFQAGMNVKNVVYALNKGYDLNKLIQSAKLVAHNKILTYEEIVDDVYSDLVNAEQVAGIKWRRYPGLNKILKGHRPGELTILTGPTGSGKTTLISELSLDLCQQGVTTLWGSFEVKNVRLVKMMLSQLSGIKLEKSLEKFSHWSDRFRQLPLYFMNFYGSVDVETVIEAVTHAANIYDIQHVVIDNLQFMLGSGVKMDDKYFLQDKAIEEFRKFSYLTKVHVSIVIHPRKLQHPLLKYLPTPLKEHVMDTNEFQEDNHVELQASSISGTAKVGQESDNILILQKLPKQPKYLQVAKNRFDGELGRTVLEYDKNSSTLSGYFAKFANVQQYHKEEDKIPSTINENSTPNNETQKSEIPTASAVNKPSVFKKSKPFWKVKPTKKDLSIAKK